MKKKISCIIPAYNEEKTIADVVSVLNKSRDIIDEIIVISDGSTDGTANEAKKNGADLVIELRKNIGKGGAILEGIKRAQGEIVLLLDADLIGLKSEHIIKILEPVIENKVEMVIGFLSDDYHQNILPHLSGQRAIKKEILQNLVDDKKFLKSGYSFEILLNKEVNKRKLKTLFIPLEGLGHIKKESKYGLTKSFFFRTSLFKKIVSIYRYYFISFLILITIISLYYIFLKPIKLLFNFQTMTLPAKDDKIMIIVAHPDDEIISSAGYIQKAIKNQSSVKIVIVTNGDSNKFFKARDVLLKNKKDFIQEGYTRMEESKNALKFLGLDEKNIIFLGFPDRNLKYLLKDNWSTPKFSNYTKTNKNIYQGTYEPGVAYTGKNLLSLLEKIIDDFQPNIIITHYPQDTHPDHSSVYIFTRLAVLSLKEREVLKMPKLYYFLVHWKLSSFPHPFEYKPNDYLYPPPEIKICNWRILSLTLEEEERKKKAINFYKSQFKSPYLRIELNTFIRKNELFCEIEK